MTYRIPRESTTSAQVDWLSVPLSDLGAEASEWIVRTLMQQLATTEAKTNPDYWEMLKTVSSYLKHLPRRSAGWSEAHERIVLDALGEADPEIRRKVVERIKEYERGLEEASDDA